jgi:hypothetical protein
MAIAGLEDLLMEDKAKQGEGGGAIQGRDKL